MSKIGKKPVILKEGVNVSLEDGIIKVVGPKGTITHFLPKGIDVKVSDIKVLVSIKEGEDTEKLKPLFGLIRSKINNMVDGVTEGFEKKLELSGVGYRATTSGSELVLSVGYSHPVKFKAPDGISFAVAENVIIVKGIDNTLVGDTAAKIRAIRPPEPYKGKGIKYSGEKIRRKAGKTAKVVGAAK